MQDMAGRAQGYKKEEPEEGENLKGEAEEAAYLPPYPIPTSSIPCTHPALVITYHADSGRGVYAKTCIPSGTILSVSPFILLTADQIKDTPLEHYTYSITVEQVITLSHKSGQKVVDKEARHGQKTVAKMQALALGLGSLFNHSLAPNVGWYMNRREGYITYRTTRDVDSGEALEIYYGDVSWMPGHVQSLTTAHNHTENERGENGEITGNTEHKRIVDVDGEEELQRDVFGLLLDDDDDDDDADDDADDNSNDDDVTSYSVMAKES